MCIFGELAIKKKKKPLSHLARKPARWDNTQKSVQVAGRTAGGASAAAMPRARPPGRDAGGFNTLRTDGGPGVVKVGDWVQCSGIR